MTRRGGIIRNVVLRVPAAANAIFAGRFLVPLRGESGGAHRGIVFPPLSAAAQVGKPPYDGTCARCHGQNVAKTGNGPPLVHQYYQPGHHADAVSYLAVSREARQDHWHVGNMPARSHLTDQRTRLIIRNVRVLQEADGIRREQG